MADQLSSGGLPGYKSKFMYQSAHVPGAGVFGGQPVQIDIPDSRYQQAVAEQPGLRDNSQAASSFISSELLGQLSPATLANLQDKAASWGVSTGMPGSGVAQDSWDTSRLLATIGLQQHGLNDFSQYQSGLEAGMTDPALAAQIASQNSVWAASPNPTMVAQHLESEANKGKWGKVAGQVIGGIAGFAFGGPQGAQVGGQLGGDIGYTVGGGQQNPGAGIGSNGYQSALGAIGSGSQPFGGGSYYGSPQPQRNALGYNSATQSAQDWYNNPQLSVDPGGGTASLNGSSGNKFSDELSALGIASFL
jgi:hypothetical protein